MDPQKEIVDGGDRLRERGADRNRLRRHGADDSLVAGGEVREEHQQPFPFRLLGFVGEREHDAFFFPSRDAIGVAVGQQGHGFLEVHDDRFGGPGASRRAQ